MVKAKVCGTPLAQDVYDLLADLYTFLSEEPPEDIKPYLPKKKPRILTADKMFRWLEENRHNLS